MAAGRPGTGRRDIPFNTVDAPGACNGGPPGHRVSHSGSARTGSRPDDAESASWPVLDAVRRAHPMLQRPSHRRRTVVDSASSIDGADGTVDGIHPHGRRCRGGAVTWAERRITEAAHHLALPRAGPASLLVPSGRGRSNRRQPVLIAHHLSSTVSWRILGEDLAQRFDAVSRAQHRASAPTSSFREWSQWLVS